MVEAPMVERERERVLGDPRGHRASVRRCSRPAFRQHQQQRRTPLTSQAPERALGLRQTRPGKGQRLGQEKQNLGVAWTGDRGDGVGEAEPRGRTGGSRGRADRTRPSPLPCSPSCRDGRLLGRVQQARPGARPAPPEGSGCLCSAAARRGELGDLIGLSSSGPGSPGSRRGPPTAWTFSGRSSEGEAGPAAEASPAPVAAWCCWAMSSLSEDCFSSGSLKVTGPFPSGDLSLGLGGTGRGFSSRKYVRQRRRCGCP